MPAAVRLQRMRLPLTLIALLALAACGGSGSGPTTPPITPAVDPCAATPGVGLRASSLNGLAITAVLPRSTDACITQRLDSHYVYRAPGVAPVGRLLVFLPGTGAVAQNYQLILAQAARAGYHAIGISYPNDTTVGARCATEASTCFAATRLEILTGQATSSVVNVTRANSIENRIVKLLRFMRTTESAADWGQFLANDSTVNWSSVSIAGHSQGGGHALFIAQRYSVLRASAYASYGDYLPNVTTPAPWVTQPYATPASRIFGFISTADELISPVNALSTWSAIGLAGSAVNVDMTSSFGTAQKFVTAATPENPNVVIAANHNVVAVDVNTPKVGGVPVFANVWRALSFP
jgi:pimeloyl-ACP methyl ester carboxylesterase